LTFPRPQRKQANNKCIKKKDISCQVGKALLQRSDPDRLRQRRSTYVINTDSDILSVILPPLTGHHTITEWRGFQNAKIPQCLALRSISFIIAMSQIIKIMINLKVLKAEREVDKIQNPFLTF
jgi:hypothetical protein